jgi:hypothetical protein
MESELLLCSTSRKIIDIPIRFPANQPQQIPFWTGYNSGLSEYKSEFSVVFYVPIIESLSCDLFFFDWLILGSTA